MQTLNSNLASLSTNILVEGFSDTSFLSLITHQKYTEDTFYLSGYETITFNQNKRFALETVLNSVVPFEKELLIVSDEPSSRGIAELCLVHGITADVLNYPSSQVEWSNLAELLNTQTNYSHVLLAISGNVDGTVEHILELSKHINHKKTDLILTSPSSVMNWENIARANVDYLICGSTGCNVSSVVLARRNKLVQTEGISRSYTHNLYAFWQKAMSRRKSVIEPMVF